jgi:hypothetical protein
MLHRLSKWTNQLRRGSALVMVLIFVVVFSIAISAILLSIQQETRQTHRARVMGDSLAAARTGLHSIANNVEHVLRRRPPQQLNGNLENLNVVVHSMVPPPIPGVEYVEDEDGDVLTYVRDRGPNDFTYRTIADVGDRWQGYTTARLDYEIVSFARDASNRAELLGFQGAGVHTRMVLDYVPLYQFAIFYDGMLELFPGPTMNVRGKVHSNENMYLSSVADIYFHEQVTCAKNVYRFKSIGGATQGGNVWVKDTGGTFREMKPDNNSKDTGDWLDHNDPKWYEDALKRWGGNLRDSAHGVGYINPPLPTGLQMRDLIARAKDTDTAEVKAARFEYKADLIITGDPGNTGSFKVYKQTLNADGSRTLTAYANPSVGGKPLISVGEFYDGQQLTVVKSLDIDMDVLRTQTIVDLGTANGVVYVSTTPGPNDTYTLAAMNQDPVFTRDAKGNIQFSTTNGMPVMSSQGWVAQGATPVPTTFVSKATNNSGRDSYMPAVRVINGTRLPRNANSSFGFYTDRPLYVVGNINTTNKCAAVFAGDSFTSTAYKTLLAVKDGTDADTLPDQLADGTAVTNGFTRDMGHDWNQSVYNWVTNSTNKAQNTTQNMIILLGNAPSVLNASTGIPISISGGVHNTIRYLEDWSSATHTFNGSIICLYESGVAARHFRDDNYSANKKYRNPPTRNYNWDSSLRAATPPPGMPFVIEVRTEPVEQISYDYAVENHPDNS